MNRRQWIQSAAMCFAGCRSQPSKKADVRAGPFLISMPDDWAKTAIIEKVPLAHLYSAEGWREHLKNKMYSMKPGYYCRPQHWAIRIPALCLQGEQFDRKSAGDDSTAPQILIHKADEWGVAFTDGVHEQIPSAQEVQQLRDDLKLWKSKDLPLGSPGYMDAELGFICLKESITFQGGHGVRMVTQWMTEADLVRRGRLHYLFLGLSDDNTCQIIATFPLDMSELPAESGEAEHLGRSTKRYEELTQDMDRYKAEAKEWIRQRAAKFTPNLQALDAMMSSLTATHWQ